MKTAHLIPDPKLDNIYNRLLKIRFIYDKKGTSPYTTWVNYRKVGEAYLFDDSDDRSSLAEWIPEEEHRLTPETHRIQIVENVRKIRPLRLKNARTHGYKDLKKAGEVVYDGKLAGE